jgi:hypothetical protein
VGIQSESHVPHFKENEIQTRRRSSNTAVIGAAVGGTIGGIALVLAVMFVLFIWKRRKRREADLEPKPLFDQEVHRDGGGEQSRTALQPALIYNPPSSRPSTPVTSDSTSQHPSPQSMTNPFYADSISAVTPAQTGRRPSRPTTVSSDSSPRSGRYPRDKSSAVHNDTSSQTPASRAPNPSSPGTTTTSPATPPPPLPNEASISGDPTFSTSTLTSEQIAFVHGLFTLNVPVAEIAAVMERMRTASGAGEESEGIVIPGGSADQESEPPPDYRR